MPRILTWRRLLRVVKETQEIGKKTQAILVLKMFVDLRLFTNQRRYCFRTSQLVARSNFPHLPRAARLLWFLICSLDFLRPLLKKKINLNGGLSNNNIESGVRGVSNYRQNILHSKNRGNTSCKASHKKEKISNKPIKEKIKKTKTTRILHNLKFENNCCSAKLPTLTSRILNGLSLMHVLVTWQWFYEAFHYWIIIYLTSSWAYF